MQDIIELSDGWFLLGWWLLAVGGGWLSGRIREALELPGDRDTASRESVSPYDVAFLRAGSNWAGDAALFSLLHAGVVRVDEDGKLRRGSKALPDDAPEIERYVLERAAGLDAKSTPEVVLARAWTHHVERLQRLGLLPSRSVGLASRFAQGCVLTAIAVVAMTWLRHNATGLSLGVVALVASLALFGLLSVRVLRNTLRPTRSGRSVLARIDAAVDLPHSLHGWPAPDLPAAQLSFVMSVFGFSAALGGACKRYRNMLDGSPIADDEPGPQSGYRADDAVLTGVARVPTKAELARVDRLAQGAVILSAVVTAVALQWIVSTAGPTGEGLRETPSFLGEAPILVRGPYGGGGRPKPMPPVVRRHRSAACDPEAAARAEKSPFAMLAEIDRREREAEGPKPLTAAERAHLGVAGSLYGVTKDRLFEVTLGERRVTTREVAPLLVAVPVLGPERALQEDEYFSVSVDALGFDRNGLLWATGDERLYFCSVATGICAAQGILPPDAWSIWFADNPQGEEVLLASDVGFTTSLLQRLAVPSIFGPLASELLGRVELCAEPGPEAPPGLLAVAAGPVQMQGGVAVAVVRDEAALRLTFLQLGLAPGVVEQHRLPGELRPVAIVPTDRGVLLFGAQGAIHEWSSRGGLRRLTETGYEWRAAAGFQLELP